MGGQQALVCVPPASSPIQEDGHDEMRPLPLQNCGTHPQNKLDYGNDSWTIHTQHIPPKSWAKECSLNCLGDNNALLA
jgi:hypothetical protein